MLRKERAHTNENNTNTLTMADNTNDTMATAPDASDDGDAVPMEDAAAAEDADLYVHIGPNPDAGSNGGGGDVKPEPEHLILVGDASYSMVSGKERQFVATGEPCMYVEGADQYKIQAGLADGSIRESFTQTRLVIKSIEDHAAECPGSLYSVVAFGSTKEEENWVVKCATIDEIDFDEIRKAMKPYADGTMLQAAVENAINFGLEIERTKPTKAPQFIILTDGKDNRDNPPYGTGQIGRSNKLRIKDLTSRKQDPWLFIYLGSGLDAVQAAHDELGIPKETAMNFVNGNSQTCSATQEAVGKMARPQYRSMKTGGGPPPAFSELQRGKSDGTGWGAGIAAAAVPQFRNAPAAAMGGGRGSSAPAMFTMLPGTKPPMMFKQPAAGQNAFSAANFVGRSAAGCVSPINAVAAAMPVAAPPPQRPGLQRQVAAAHSSSDDNGRGHAGAHCM